MKKKFIILTLCFSIIFSSINYEKAYADGGIISIPMLSVVASLAVATGVALTDADDIYDIGRIFYDKYKTRWDEVKTIFSTSVALNKATRKVSVKNTFLDLVKSCFDDTFPNAEGDIVVSTPLSVMNGIRYDMLKSPLVYNFGEYSLTIAPPTYLSGEYRYSYQIKNNIGIGSGGTLLTTIKTKEADVPSVELVVTGSVLSTKILTSHNYNFNKSVDIKKHVEDWGLNFGNVGTLPYVPGTYDDTVLKDRDDIGVYVPGNLGDLVGGNVKPGDIVGDVAPPWVGTGVGNPSIPNVENPSIDIDKDITFPIVGEGVGEGEGEGEGEVVPPNIDIFPPWGGGIDFTPVTQNSSFTEKFPFSLASDIKGILSVFDVEPKAPKFKVPIVSEELEMDLSQFTVWAAIIRFFILVGFVIGLINVTRKVIG